MHPRRAEVDRDAVQVDGVQPPADPVAGLQDGDRDAGLVKSPGGDQTGDPRADDDHLRDRARGRGGHLGSAVVQSQAAARGGRRLPCRASDDQSQSSRGHGGHQQRPPAELSTLAFVHHHDD